VTIEVLSDRQGAVTEGGEDDQHQTRSEPKEVKGEWNLPQVEENDPKVACAHEIDRKCQQHISRESGGEEEIGAQQIEPPADHQEPDDPRRADYRNENVPVLPSGALHKDCANGHDRTKQE
jgi:hypothetical protein